MGERQYAIGEPMMAVETARGENLTKWLFKVLKLLLADDAGAHFLITNQSLSELLRLYEQPLLNAIRAEAEPMIFAIWLNDISEFRKEWFDYDPHSLARYQGLQMKVMTESATHSAHQKCEKRKVTRPASPPRAIGRAKTKRKVVRRKFRGRGA
jgi:hypothetical protein